MRVDPRIVRFLFDYLKEKGGRPNWNETAVVVNKKFGTSYTRKTMPTVYHRYNKGQTSPDPLMPHTGQADSFADRVQIIRTSKKTPGNLPADDWRRVFTEAQGIRDIVSDRELYCAATIKTKTPVALCFFGDWHLGSAHTDYQRLYADAQFVAETENIYCGISGDRTDMFVPGFKDASAVMGQLAPPDLQLEAMDSLLKLLGPKVVAAIGGNHDTMARRKTGVDVERWVRKGYSFSYMPHGGVLTLTVGDQAYKILWKHHYRFNSSLNQFNSHHRMMELLEPTADLIVTEHEHNPGIESVERGTGEARRTVISIRTGAYKIDDGYSMDFFKEGRPGPQTVILFPDRKKVLAMHGVEALQDAAIYLRGVNGKT